MNHPLEGLFRKEFGLIFRQDNDLGEKPLREPSSSEKIMLNLNSFINWWVTLANSPLLEDTMYEIEKLKKHIMNGCLLGLPPGFGTEKN